MNLLHEYWPSAGRKAVLALGLGPIRHPQDNTEAIIHTSIGLVTYISLISYDPSKQKL